jgi:RNA polymerase sigma-70 factor, ECF subfamily
LDQKTGGAEATTEPSKISAEMARRIAGEIPRLRRYAMFLTRDKDRADDLVQDCLLRGISRLHQWQPGTNFRAWLLTILRNVFLTGLRRDRHITLVTADALEEIPDPLASVVSPDMAVDLLAVQRAFVRLPAPHREILLIVGVEDLTYKEAAGVLGMPIGTVRSRLSRARTAMRHEMSYVRQGVDDGRATRNDGKAGRAADL